MGSIGGEGMSSSRPPLFDGTNYDYWSSRMRLHVQAVDYNLWKIIKNGPLIPTIKKTETQDDGKTKSVTVPVDMDDIDNLDLEDAEIKKVSQNCKAINILHLGLCMEEYGRIKNCKTAKDIWDCLETTHVGTSQVKMSKIRMLTTDYEAFKMKEGESLTDMHQRFTLITNNLSSLGKNFTTGEINGKILESLTSEFKAIKVAITVSKDITNMSKEELMGILLTEELDINKNKKPNKQSLALLSAETKMISKGKEKVDRDEDYEDDIALIAKNFRKFLKFSKKTGDSSKRDDNKRFRPKAYNKVEPPRCYECNKPGHLRADCYQLKRKPQNGKAMHVTWDDDVSSDGSDEELTNVICLMAKDYENEVTLNLSSSLNSSTSHDYNVNEFNDDNSELEIDDETELVDMYEELCNEHSKLIDMNLDLSRSVKKYQATVSELEKEIEQLKSSPKNNVDLEKLELKQHLDKAKTEIEILKGDLLKYEVGNVTLNNILASQRKNNNKRGLGYEGNETPILYKSQSTKVRFIKNESTPSCSTSLKSKFLCDYCQKGDHAYSRCHIKKLVDLGTLIPDYKKPKWVVRSNGNANTQGPNDSWGPRMRH